MTDDTPVLALPDDIYHVPNGKIVSVVTYLEQVALPARDRFPVPKGVGLVPWDRPDLDDYLALFREIGAPWLWFGHLRLSRQQLEAVLYAEDNRLWRVERDGAAIGMLELHWEDNGDVKVAYFGFVPGETGHGLGQWLMDEAQRIAWTDARTTRLKVNTCTADDPKAVGFYRKMGFTPYRRGIEMIEDPRLAGLYPRDAGPSNLPIIE